MIDLISTVVGSTICSRFDNNASQVWSLASTYCIFLTARLWSVRVEGANSSESIITVIILVWRNLRGQLGLTFRWLAQYQSRTQIGYYLLWLTFTSIRNRLWTFEHSPMINQIKLRGRRRINESHHRSFYPSCYPPYPGHVGPALSRRLLQQPASVTPSYDDGR